LTTLARGIPVDDALELNMPNAGIVEKLSELTYVVLGQPIAQVTVAEPHSGEASAGHGLDSVEQIVRADLGAARGRQLAVAGNGDECGDEIVGHCVCLLVLGLRAALMKESMRRGPLR
jgi:hypothetical protein